MNDKTKLSLIGHLISYFWELAPMETITEDEAWRETGRTLGLIECIESVISYEGE